MIAPEIVPIAQDKNFGPWCAGKVHVSLHPYTGTQIRGANMRAAKGIAADACGLPAAYRFDGINLCSRHAGDRALTILRDQPLITARKRDWIDVRR